MTCVCIAAHTLPGQTKPAAGKTPLKGEARELYIVHVHTAPMRYRNFHIIPGRNPSSSVLVFYAFIYILCKLTNMLSCVIVVI